MTKAKDTAIDQTAISADSFNVADDSADAYIEHVLKCVAKTPLSHHQDLVERVDTPFRAGVGIHSIGAYKFY